MKQTDLLRLGRLIARFPRVRILVVGDLMLDQFIWGRVERISPEAPVPVVQVTRETFHLGGAANVVQNIRSLGGRATAAGVVGRDSAGRHVLEELRRIGAGTAGITVPRDSVTIRKTRIIAHNQQVVRFDREQPHLQDRITARLIAFLRRHLREFDAVVVSDYGKGVVTQPLLEYLAAERAERRFRLIVDPKKENYAHYRNISLATPNLAEASEAAGVRIQDDSSLREAGAALLDRWQAEAVLITRGEEGMTLFTPPGEVCHFPTMARQVFDVTGAGDTVIATCAQALAAGAALGDAAMLANYAAGIVVGKLGTATVGAEELREQIGRRRGRREGR